MTLMLPVIDLKSSTMSTTDKPSLLTIPGEIRNKIWRMLLTTSYAFKEPISEGDREAHYEVQLAILRVNRQIYNETRSILREGNMWIFLCIAMPKEPVYYVDEIARLPVVSRSVCTEGLNEIQNCYLGMNSHALNIIFYPDYNYWHENYDCHIMIMGPESLPYLLQLLYAELYIQYFKLSNTFLEMHLGQSACFAHSRLRKEILEPFSAARGFRSVFIHDNKDETFASSLMVKMKSPWGSTTELLDFSDAYLRRGDAAAAAGLTKAASLYYEQGYQFTFFAGQSYIRNVYPHANPAYIPHRIASMLSAFDTRWAKALLKLRCYADVQRVAVCVLGREHQNRATSAEKVQLVLCCALASLGLGETARFSQIMRGLFQGGCHLGVFPTGSGWTGTVRGEIFPGKFSMIKIKDAMIKEFDDLVAYCKEGEEGSLRRIDTEGALPDREEIDFPVAQDWSAIAARYERGVRRGTR